MDTEAIRSKLEREVDEHNELAKNIEKAQVELHQRRGRISLLEELLKNSEPQDAPEEQQEPAPNG